MTGAIILAAGAATRMGTLKQLLPYRGGTLLGHAIHQAIAAGFEQIAVVVGAQAETVRAAIPDDRVDVVENRGWRSGMGSSISVGMRRLREGHAALDSVAILLSDQPLIESHHLKEMARLLHSRDAAVVAAEYNETLGVPAIFKQELFAQLEALPPEAGARFLLRDSNISLVRFPLPEAGVDVDTPDDFAALTSSAEQAGESPGPEFRK